MNRFKRGADPKTVLGLGKYSGLADWWNKIIENEDYDNGKRDRIGNNWRQKDDLMKYITHKLVDVLRKEDDPGWCRVDTRGLGGKKLYASVNNKYQSVQLTLDLDTLELSICGSSLNTPEIMVGSFGRNPGDIICKILEYHDILLTEKENKEIERQMKSYMDIAHETILKLKDLNLADEDMVSILMDKANERMVKMDNMLKKVSM
ncbi:MAG: hypothetical protein HC831_02190 [Chloroflexia bacterium]|nr:hypothetical protein [Chloroflexia bacterium]